MDSLSGAEPVSVPVKSKTDNAMDGLLDRVSFYDKKITKVLKYLSMVESASPSSKQVVEQIRRELEKKPE